MPEIDGWHPMDSSGGADTVDEVKAAIDEFLDDPTVPMEDTLSRAEELAEHVADRVAWFREDLRYKKRGRK